ncbi:MAG: leucine-rich repeat protein, partial [Bacteroidales bacterium]|nr:leucine-rich repeat protein [Bacteroidales bacterium]
GTIDARDFKTMRDEMPVLTNIDLSRVQIDYYYGNEGTIDTSNNSYPENSVPRNAFYNQNTAQGKSGLKFIILPLTSTTIGLSAFWACSDLTAIDIPIFVTSIEAFAFGHCIGLTSINIPASVNRIALGALSYFNGKITVDENNLTYSAIDGVLFNKNQTELIQCPISKTGEYTIPSSVAIIQDEAFAFCRGLTKVMIPSTVISIRHYAFTFCDNLDSIFAFPFIPVDLNSSLDVFSGVNKNTCNLYVPVGSKTAYQTANQWEEFKNIIEMPNQAPIANAGTDRTVTAGSLVILDGIDSSDPEMSSLTYRWTAPTGITLNDSTVSNPTFTAPEVKNDSSYTFSLVVNDGTDDSPADQVVITILKVSMTGIHESLDLNKLQIYPNPTKGLLEISMEGLQEQDYCIKVYNSIGQMQLAPIKSNEGKVLKIDLSSFTNGIYFIKVTTKNQSCQKKIIKK